jgi:hypothetical protein
MRLLLFLLVGIALGMNCVTSANDAIEADAQRCDALTLSTKVFQVAVAFAGAVAFIALQVL